MALHATRWTALLPILLSGLEGLLVDLLGVFGQVVHLVGHRSSFLSSTSTTYPYPVFEREPAPASSKVVPTGQVLHRLTRASKDYVGPSRDLTYHRDRHLDAPRQGVQDGTGSGDQELVVLAPGRRQLLGITAERSDELPGIFGHGEEV